MKVEAYCTLEEVRRFLIESTCKSFIPREYLKNGEIFPERRIKEALIHVEAEEKEDVQQIGDITFIRAKNVLGIIYNSKSGRTKLKWRQIYKDLGKLSGEASSNTLVNLITAGIRKIEPIRNDV
ncbi:hypothetical protein DRN86_00380 [Candidatus Geothermarchaeota archaeon]|nr:MAG: hypothetical protein DRN86_00380 [Candidatus Geothermarchaeota archaeon]